MTTLLIDTNILLLLIIGSADPSYIGAHKRLRNDYTSTDFAVLLRIVDAYDDIVTTPHVLTEVSNLMRQIGNPARDRIQEAFRSFVLHDQELEARSIDGCRHEQFIGLGLTDAVLLRICERDDLSETRIELLTADEPLYNQALSRGIPAELFV